MKSRRRKFNRAARWTMLMLVDIADDLRSLRPVTPIHREPELAAHLDVLHDLVNRVLDDTDMPVAMACQQLDNCGRFAASLFDCMEDEE